MNPIISKSAAWAACGLFLALSVQAGEPVYPVKVMRQRPLFRRSEGQPRLLDGHDAVGTLSKVHG